MQINRFWLRVTGLAGILGGLVLFGGDMLFYFSLQSDDLKFNMGHTSDLRIQLSGLTALIAVWLYMLGLWHVYYAFKPASSAVRHTVLISFGSVLIAYGVVHGAYVAIAATAKLAVQNHLDMEAATLLAVQTNHLLRYFVYPPFAVLSAVFISQVWKRKTLYPRWIIIFFPLIPFLFQGLIIKVVSGPALIILGGGFLNLILVLFFTASTIALWNRGDKGVIKKAAL